MPEDVASENIDWVVRTAKDKHESQAQEGQQGRILQLVVALLSELKKVDHTQAQVLWEIEAVVNSVSHTEGVDAWEFPNVLVRIGHFVDRLRLL